MVEIYLKPNHDKVTPEFVEELFDVEGVSIFRTTAESYSVDLNEGRSVETERLTIHPYSK